MKKVFIISIVLLTIVLIFLGIYNFSFRKTPSATIIQPVVNVPVTQELIPMSVPVTTKKIVAVSSNPVIGVVSDEKAGDIKYYDASTGLLWKIDKTEQEKQVTNTNVLGLESVAWSIDKSRVLTNTQKDGKNSFYMYDYNTQKGTPLKDGLDTAVWDNTGEKIIYKYFDSKSGQRTLNTANPDGSNWQKIADIAVKSISIAPVPTVGAVSYWNTPSANEETHLQVVNIIGGEIKNILSGRYGADYLWSPKGDQALVSSLATIGAKTVMLGLVSAEGVYQDLNIPTLASKCVWSDDAKTIYYALPGNIPSDAVMPNDYQDNKFNTDDTFWKMDVATGNKQRIIEASEIGGKYDSSNLFLSSDESALYFVNKVDKKLYKLSF